MLCETQQPCRPAPRHPKLGKWETWRRVVRRGLPSALPLKMSYPTRPTGAIPLLAGRPSKRLAPSKAAKFSGKSTR